MSVVSQNGLPACAVRQLKTFTLWNSLPIWKPITPPFAASFLSRSSGIVRGMSLKLRRPWCVARTRVGADVDRLRDRLVRAVGDVDHHAEAIGFADDGAAAVVEAVPLRRRAAGVGEVVGPVVRRQLERAQAEAIERAQDREVAVEIETAFEVHEGGDLSRPADALDIGRREGELDLVLVPCELIVSGVDEPEHLLRLQARRVVLLGHEQAEEHRVEAALFRASQVELPVVHALPHVAAVVELAIDDVDVGVEDERVLMERPGAIGHLTLR